jgi:hypothetical protein
VSRSFSEVVVPDVPAGEVVLRDVPDGAVVPLPEVPDGDVVPLPDVPAAGVRRVPLPAVPLLLVPAPLQFAAIIRTDVTRTRCVPLSLDPDVAAAPLADPARREERAGVSFTSMPVTSTRCPTCALWSMPLSVYDELPDALELAVSLAPRFCPPLVPAAPLPAIALESMNVWPVALRAVARDALLLPLVPTAAF